MGLLWVIQSECRYVIVAVTATTQTANSGPIFALLYLLSVSKVNYGAMLQTNADRSRLTHFGTRV